MNKKKATCADIEKIVKVLKEHELKPDKDGLITIGEWYIPSTPKQDKKMMEKIKMEYVGDPTESPFYRDSVGGEELHENTR